MQGIDIAIFAYLIEQIADAWKEHQSRGNNFLLEPGYFSTEFFFFRIVLKLQLFTQRVDTAYSMRTSQRDS